ncbi:MAG: hypothetical protein ABIA37_01860 [Candidatus Woesearchaeota archaeon]
MTEIKQDLLDNFKDFVESAERDLQEKRYNPAISSYFKAIAILCDLMIYKEKGLLPKNHRERFLFLEINYKEAYDLISPLFKEYTDSYNLRIQKENVLRLKESVERLKEIFQIKG